MAFIDVIKTLTPVEVSILKYSYEYFYSQNLGERTSLIIDLDKDCIMKELGIDAMTYDTAVDNLVRCQVMALPSGMFDGGGRVRLLTAFGITFLKACIAESHSAPSRHSNA